MRIGTADAKLLSEEEIFGSKTVAVLFLALFFVPGCSSVRYPPDVHDVAVRAAIKLAKPSLEKMFFARSPIAAPSQTQFAIVEHPPGGEFRALTKKFVSYDASGNLELAPGDYVLPVMTYCMKSEGSSPDAHRYTLSRLAGSMAHVIREINLKALPKFAPRNVQILSWSIQNGLKYDEMTPESRRIVDDAIPDLKSELRRSFLENFSGEWNQLADKSRGLIPPFETVTDEFLSELGDVGNAIVKIREFHRLIKVVGNDYPRLSQMIHLPGLPVEGKEVSPVWSKISENTYARFITKGHFQEVGQLEIRVLPPGPGRQINAVNIAPVKIDISSLIADPG